MKDRELDKIELDQKVSIMHHDEWKNGTIVAIGKAGVTVELDEEYEGTGHGGDCTGFEDYGLETSRPGERCWWVRDYDLRAPIEKEKTDGQL